MRHSALRDGKRLIWKTETLWQKVSDLEPFEVEVESFPELDLDCWFQKEKIPTLRAVAEHCKKINSAAKEFPVILNDDGSLMDGGHRLCRALIDNQKTISAVRFKTMPEPDETLPE